MSQLRADHWQYTTQVTPDASGIAKMHRFLDRVRDDHPELVPADRLGFRTAIAELVANVIQHSGVPRRMTVRLAVSVLDDRLVGEVAAAGPEVEWSDTDAERGRGLLLVEALCGVGYRRSDGVNTWHLERPRTNRRTVEPKQP